MDDIVDDVEDEQDVGDVEEQQLASRWQSLQEEEDDERVKWYSDAYHFLKAREQEHGEHWFCHHSEVSGPLLDLLDRHREEPTVQALYKDFTRQLAACSDCVVSYHSEKWRCREESLREARSLDVLRVVNSLRLAGGLHQPDQEVPQQLLNGLFEAICYLPDLDDEELVGLLSEALLSLNATHSLDIAAGGRYQGVYFLLAHESAAIRSHMLKAAKELGRFETEEEAKEALELTVDHWVRLLEYDLFSAPPEVNEISRVRHRPQKLHVWGGLDLCLDLLSPAACAAIVDHQPSLIPIVLNHSCAPPPLQHQHQQRGAGGGDHVQWRALSCLGHLLLRMDSMVWESTSYQPHIVVDDLIDQAFKASAERFQKKLIHLLEHILRSLEAHGGTALDPLRRRVLYFFTFQVPNSNNFGGLARGLALHSAFGIVTQAMASGVSPAAIMHICGPSLVHCLTQPREITHIEAHKLAVSLVESILRSDSAVLAAINLSWETPEGEAEEEEDFIASLAVDNADTWACCPALWQGVSRHSNVRVGTALLSAAANLAFTSSVPGGPSGPANKSTDDGGWCRDGTEAMVRMEGARAWAVPNGWMDESQPNSVLARHQPLELLEEMRVAAVTQIDHIACSGRLVVSRSSGSMGAYTPSEQTQLFRALILISIGWHARLRTASQNCLMGCTEAQSPNDVLETLAASSPGREALREAVRTVLRRWNHGAEDTAPAEMVQCGQAFDLVACLRISGSFLGSSTDARAQAENLDEEGEGLVQELRGFWLELLLSCRRSLVAPAPPDEVAPPPPASQPVLRELFSAVQENFAVPGCSIEGSPGAELLPRAASELVDWAGPILALPHSSEVQSAWLSATLAVVKGCLPGGDSNCHTMENQALEQLEAIVKERGRGMPADYRIEFSRLLPNGGPGNLGLRNPLDNLLVRAKPAGAGADASSSDRHHQDDRARQSAQQKQGSRAAVVPPRGAPAATRDVIDLTSDQEDTEEDAEDEPFAPDDGGDEDTGVVIDLTSGNPTLRKVAAASAAAFPFARHHQEASNPSMQAKLISAARAPSKAARKAPPAAPLATGANIAPNASSITSSAARLAKFLAVGSRQAAAAAASAPPAAAKAQAQRGKTAAPGGATKPLAQKQHPWPRVPMADEVQIWPSAWPKGVPVRREAVQAATSLGGTAGLHHLSSGNKQGGSMENNRAKQSSNRGNTSLQRHPSVEARQPGGPERPHQPPPPAAAAAAAGLPARPAAAPPPPRAARPLKASNDDDLFYGMGSRIGYRLPSARPGPSGPRRTTKAFTPMVSSSAPYAMRRSALGSAQRQQQQPQVLKIKEVQAEVLGWDYFKQVVSSAKKEAKLPKSMQRFPDLETYSQYFRRLLVEELRASLESDFQEITRTPGPLQGFTLRQYGGMQQQSENRILVRFEVDQEQLRVLRDAQGPNCNPRENDLFLMTRRPWKDTVAFKEQHPRVHTLAFVTKSEGHGGQLIVSTLMNLGSDMDTGGVQSPSCRSAQVLKLMLPRSSWTAVRVTSLTPQLREITALSSMHNFPLRIRGSILEPSGAARAIPRSARLEDSGVPQGLRAQLEKDYNQSQLNAIAAAVSRQAPLTLVQGPPGTGKTSAIIGFISAIAALAERSAPAEGVRRVPSMPQGEDEVSWEAQAAVMEAGQPPPAARILVCAQSNAAIDELLVRVAKGGLFNSSGKRRPAAVVRLGVVTGNCRVGKFHIDEWASRRNRKAAENEESDAAAVSVSSLKTDLQKVESQIREARVRSERRALKAGAAEAAGADQGLEQLQDQRRQLMVKLDVAERKAFKATGRADVVRRDEKAQVLLDSELVLCTLSSSGGDLLRLAQHLAQRGAGGPHANSSNNTLFDALIIDEAAQAVEPAALIPMQLLRPNSKVILVGDTNQLPPTVLSQAPGAAGLSKSLFARMQEAKYPVNLLDVQYRMHPAISAFPCKHFYSGKLKDGIEGCSRTAHYHKVKCFGPYAFYDCREGTMRSSGASIVNAEEVELVGTILQSLHRDYPGELGTVAVLTPYKAQKMALERKLRSVLGDSAASAIPVNTVDGYQGQEADIVIFSCVRAEKPVSGGSRPGSRGLGFLTDIRRLNVAITRAKCSLWIVGHADTLQRDDTWAALISDAKARDVFLGVPRPYRSFLVSFASSRGEAGGLSGWNEDRRAPGRGAHLQESSRERLDGSSLPRSHGTKPAASSNAASDGVRGSITPSRRSDGRQHLVARHDNRGNTGHTSGSRAVSKLDRKEEERRNKSGTNALVRRPSGAPRDASSGSSSLGRPARHDGSEVKQRAPSAEAMTHRNREGGTGKADRRAAPQDTREETLSNRRVVRRDGEEGMRREGSKGRAVSSASARQQHHQKPPAIKHGGLTAALDKPRETQNKRKREDPSDAGATTAAAADAPQPGSGSNSAVRRRVVTGSRRPVTSGAPAQSESSDHHLPRRPNLSASQQPRAGPIRQQSTDQDWQMAAMAMARIDVKQQQSRPAGSGKVAPPQFKSRGNRR